MITNNTYRLLDILLLASNYSWSRSLDCRGQGSALSNLSWDLTPRAPNGVLVSLSKKQHKSQGLVHLKRTVSALKKPSALHEVLLVLPMRCGEKSNDWLWSYLVSWYSLEILGQGRGKMTCRGWRKKKGNRIITNRLSSKNMCVIIL